MGSSLADACIGDSERSFHAKAAAPFGAGFGVRRADQVALLGAHADGVIVGSALVEVLERGADPAVFLRSLRT